MKYGDHIPPEVREKLTIVDEIEAALDACEHPYADEAPWCNVCGAMRFTGGPWLKPHWRDRLILGWRTERLDDATIAALTKRRST